jgi:hypothetical protein
MEGEAQVHNKIRLAILFLVFVAVGLAGVFFILSRHEKTESGEATTNAPVPHAPKPSPAVPLNGSKSANNSNVPAMPGLGSNTSSQPWPPDGMLVTAHHKGRHGCDGMLTLKTSGLQFTCPGDEGKSFFVALNDIRGADNDGIITTSGSKYHFDKVAGGGKDYTEQLFAEWLAHVHVAQRSDQ